MDTAKVPGVPAFTRLPVELLIMILDYCVPGESAKQLTYFSNLKALRLSCRQYAYLPKVLKMLFYTIHLVASPEHVHLADTTNLSGIEPYVKEVVMEPTKYGWGMTYGVFEDIVLIAPLQDFCDKENEKTRTIRRETGSSAGSILRPDEEFSKLGMRGFIRQYMDGKGPFTDMEIRKGYDRYKQHAEKDREMFENNEIQRAWTKALVQLPNARRFRISSWDPERDCLRRQQTKVAWKNLGCEIYEHNHSYGEGHASYVCRRLQESVGEALFSAAVRSLIAAQSKIAQLDINCCVDGCFKWADNGELTALDLSELHTLVFRPETAYTIPEAVFQDRCGRALTAILRKCATSLKALELKPDVPLVWPPENMETEDDRIAFPALERFRIGTGIGINVRLKAFAEFLNQAPKLQYLQLDASGHLKDGEWRDLWRAIRYHPSRMHLHFEQLHCNGFSILNMKHYTGEASKSTSDDDPWMNLHYSLENYLSNKRHWDRSCQMWFDDGEGNETTTDYGSDTEDEDAGDGGMDEDGAA